MSFFKADFKRAVTNKGLIISILLLSIIFIHAIRVNVNFEVEVSTYEIIVDAMALSGFTPFAAIFPVMGYSVAFCEEYHSGYLKMMTSRMDWKRYGVIRMVTTGITGGTAIAICLEHMACQIMVCMQEQECNIIWKIMGMDTFLLERLY